MISTLAIGNYRSIRALSVALARLNVVTGPNGSGKSSLYRSLRLLAATVSGDLVAALAREGGLPSSFWAGPETIGRAVRAGTYPVQGTRRSGPARLLLGFGCDDLSYAIDLGHPSGMGHAAHDEPSLFTLDPEIKRECIWTGPVLRRSNLVVDRRGPRLLTVDDGGNWTTLPDSLTGFDSMFTDHADPHMAPEMILMRQRIRGWRFYDHIRTDAASPCRMPQIGTHTPILADDGSDLAAALRTIQEIGDRDGLAAAIDDAFPGSTVDIAERDGWFEIGMSQHGLLRPLKAAELSDGTLRYLALIAALMTPRPPTLMVLNEPETSLHPDLIAPLARLIIAAAERSQIIVVTHDTRLSQVLADAREASCIRLAKSFGETVVEGDPPVPRWEWPGR